ncbi:MAG: signal recognition particle protein, partial [Flavobacteriales bacterium]|nr:signal recognition particle protein [Flavobacteriales bacterium]
KIAKDQFGFDDFLEQIGQIKKMGNMKELMGMIPGVGKAMKDLDIPDDAFKGIESIIKSMTPQERREPSIINGSRRQRLAKGSGTSVEAVNKLMKQFEETRKMMKMMGDKSKMKAMMQRMQQMQGMRR